MIIFGPRATTPGQKHTCHKNNPTQSTMQKPVLIISLNMSRSCTLKGDIKYSTKKLGMLQ